MTLLAGALLGATYFYWIAGPRIISPVEALWTLKFDWRVHFLGWHLFRHEPWHWPPGRIEAYYAPIGTAVGLTDSIPIAAFLVKPFSPWLPPVFQYLGLWMWLCYALQGVFGVLLVRTFTPSRVVQLLGAALFVLSPTLLNRLAHPALCSHWLLLWALWAALRDGRHRPHPWEAAAMGLVAGLVHPYLTVMMLPLLGAPALGPGVRGRLAILGTAALAAGCAIAGWYLSGIFSSTGTSTLATEGLGYFSMNVLGPLTPSGFSTLLPEWPVATGGQPFEGMQYLGAGTLVLLAVALVLRTVRPRLAPVTPRRWAGLTIVALTLAAFAISPRITVGADVVADLSGPWAGWMSIFRATGRFFWPMSYLLLTACVATLVTRVPERIAALILALVVSVQQIDLRTMQAARRQIARSDAFHAFDRHFVSPVWAAALPAYRHLVLLPPPHCSDAPVDYGDAAYTAGIHGLSINAGHVARYDRSRVLSYCHDVGEIMKRGLLNDDSVYVLATTDLPALRRAAPTAHCGEIDGLGVCVTAGPAYSAWNGALP